MGISAVLNQNVYLAAICIWIGLFFDFFDGFVARLLKVSSEMGKQLDSLADMTTFGILPSVLLFTEMKELSLGNTAYTAFLLAIFSAWRLAKFNIDIYQTYEFRGLPTPANALFWSVMPFLKSYTYFVESWIFVALCILFSYLLVANIPLMALKFQNYSFKENLFRYIFLFLCLVMFLVLQVLAIPFIILIYILISFIANLQKL